MKIATHQMQKASRRRHFLLSTRTTTGLLQTSGVFLMLSFFHLSITVHRLTFSVKNHHHAPVPVAHANDERMPLQSQEDVPIDQPRKSSLSLPKIVFAAVVRDMGSSHGDSRTNAMQYFGYYAPKFLKLASSITREFHLIVYENDSKDDTKSALQYFFGNRSDVTLLMEDGVAGADKKVGPVSVERTNQIAVARNKILRHTEHYFQHYDYFAMMDMDGVCGGPNMTMSFDVNIFKHALLDLRDKWDAITFRFEPYYDLWALREEEYMPENFWHGKKALNKVQTPADVVPLFESVPWPDGLVAVESSFEMFEIIRMPFITNGTARYSGTDGNGKADCEHVAFNRDLRKMGARIRLSPMVYCEGDSGYMPLPEEITARWS